MPRFRNAFALLTILLLSSGCSPLERQYLRDGVGSELYEADVAAQTATQNSYVQNICEQAGLGVAGSCDPETSGSRGWTAFVQAGMNDVDRRCDAYLVWLDGRRRSRGPVLQELSDLRTATAAILVATDAGVEPLAIAAAAFGLASSSFTNVDGSLVYALDQSTVQSVVLSAQTRFRTSLPTRIDNRAAAVFALRSYLRLCMPMTIDTQVNTTVRLFERGDHLDVGALSDARDHPLIGGAAVRTALVANARAPLPPMPPKSDDGPLHRTTDPAARPLVSPGGPYERQLEAYPTELVAMQRKLCMVPADGRLTSSTREAILSFLRDHKKDQHYPSEITHQDYNYIRFTFHQNQC